MGAGRRSSFELDRLQYPQGGACQREGGGEELSGVRKEEKEKEEEEEEEGEGEGEGENSTVFDERSCVMSLL